MGAPAALAVMGGGSLLQAYGTYQQGKAQEKAAKFNAKLAEVKGRQRESAVRRSGRRQMGAIRASIAKSGVTTAGSPLEVMAESAAAIEMDALNARFGAESEAAALRREGAARMQAARIGAASQILSGGGRMASAGMQMGAF